MRSIKSWSGRCLVFLRNRVALLFCGIGFLGLVLRMGVWFCSWNAIMGLEKWVGFGKI